MSDELARLRALAERLRRLRILDEVGSDNQLGHEAADGIVRLLDDVERAERERDEARMVAATGRQYVAEAEQQRARAERLEAALKFYAERDHLYGSMADDWEDCSDQDAAGWLFPPEPVDGESWGVETGLVARAALDAARAGEG